MPDPEIWALTSKKGWPKIAYDKTIWIPCPETFDGSMTREEWAQGFASLWWEASGFKHGKRQVRGWRRPCSSCSRASTPPSRATAW